MILLMVGLACPASRAGQGGCASADDHGNTYTLASAVILQQPMAGTIEQRQDRDLFCFQAKPYHHYDIHSQPSGGSTLFGTEMRLFEADGDTLLQRDTSLPGGSLTFTADNPGVIRSWYIDVRSFAEYSTGNYTLDVQETPPVDADQDGLPDLWESLHQLATNSGLGDDGAGGDPDRDGLTNEEELALGTNPQSASSALRISRMVRANNRIQSIEWQAQPFARYRLFRKDRITDTDWQFVAEVIQPGTSTTGSYPLANPPPDAVFYVALVNQ